MIAYHYSKNTDPPAVVEVWNDAVTGRGGFPLRTPGLLERWLFCKPYFRPDDLILARDPDAGNRPVGLALSGFGPNAELTGLSDLGVVCAVLVRPEYRRRGIGRELLTRAEARLRERGAGRVVVGGQWPANPYLFGLYGGSNSPGVLASEPDAGPFLEKMGFVPTDPVLVLQRRLDVPLTLADTRFGLLRRRYDAQVLRAASVGSWWQDCVWGSLEPVELRMTDKLTGLPAARAVVWELEGFSWKWGHPSAGVLDVQVRPDLRQSGLGKLLLSHALRFLQDQFFAVAELQVVASNTAGLGLCRGLGFEEVDTGHVYRRPNELPSTDEPADTPAG